MAVYVEIVKDYKKCKEPLLYLLKKLSLPFSSPIFIKPNILGLYKKESGIITHPEFIYALIEALKELGASSIYIGEIPQIGLRSRDVAKVFDERRLKKYGARYIFLDEEKFFEVRWHFGILKIPCIIKDCLYINVPKLKTHMLTKLTLSLKNQKGLLDQKTKQCFHKDYPLDEAIAYLAKVIFPHAVIVDGIWALHGQGPATSGKKIKAEIIVAGRNAVEVDAACAKIVGFDAKLIPHIMKASALGLGEIEPEIIGSFKKIHFLPPSPFIKKWRLYVWGTANACSGCLSTLARMKKILHNPFVFYKAVKAFLLSRTHIIVGKNATLPKMDGKIICFGECTKELAETHSLPYIKGCPPELEYFLKKL